MFRKKKSKRLYLPAKKKWYARQRPVKRKKFWVRGKKKTHLKRQINLFKQRWFYWILGGVGLLGLLLIFFFSTYLKIAEINVVRYDFNVNSAAIQDVLKPYIGENILLFDRDLVIQTVKENFEEYAQVHVKKELPNTLRVELEAQPLLFNVRASYILPEINDQEANPEDEPLETDENNPPEQEIPEEPIEPTEQLAILNGAGQVLLTQEENLELPTMVVEQLTHPLENKEILISPERLQNLQAAIERFEKAFPDQRIERVQYFPDGREVHLEVKNGLTLWITFQKDPVEQVDKLYSIYEPAALDQEDLAYIDLRIAEKVIYCPQGARCDQ